MPGEPAPVYPDWFNDSIVCWYSPSKQKLTQLDVIESYAEDFTNWTYFSIRGTATITSNTIIITESKDINNVIEDKVEPYSDISIYVTGVTEDTYIIVRDRTGRRGEIKKNGKYTFKNNDLFFGFSVNKIGECNITIKQLPTSILKDFSGNGLDAYMYGFRGKLNSGMGLYKVDYTTYNNSGNQNVTDIKPNSFVLLAGALSRLGLPYSSIIGEYIPSYAIRIQGISGGTITYYYRNENGKQLTYVIDADGDYILPPCYSEGTEGTAVNIVSNNNINNVTITQIPDYPNQLCYSGKEYCVSYNQPILTDYTVIADRTWFDKQINHNFANNTYLDDAVNRGFLFEQIKSDTEVWATSFGTNNAVQMAPDGIIYQTKNSYNGTPINSGNATYIDKIVIGCYLDKRQVNPNYFYHGCHSDFLLFNRTLNEDEINWLKENIYNIEI